MAKKIKILIICIAVFLSCLIFASCSNEQLQWNEPPTFDFDSLTHTTVPVGVSTMEIEENGQTLDFKIIRTFEDLDNIRNDIEEDLRIRKNYILANDIDFMGLDDGKIFRSIEGYFLGIFNGNNHKLANITFLGYRRATPSALFCYVGDDKGGVGVVRNLIVTGNIFSNHWSASIAHTNYGIIENCVNFANVTARTHSQGGIVSENMESGNIKNCINYGQIGVLDDGEWKTSGEGYVGGAWSAGAGGIAGSNGGIIENCINYGTVLGGRVTSGIAGSTGSNQIENCTNYGTIMLVKIQSSDKFDNGGIVGTYGSWNDKPKADKTINCKNYGSIITIENK